MLMYFHFEGENSEGERERGVFIWCSLCFRKCMANIGVEIEEGREKWSLSMCLQKVISYLSRW